MRQEKSPRSSRSQPCFAERGLVTLGSPAVRRSRAPSRRDSATYSNVCWPPGKGCYAQLDPTALSVLNMLLPAVWTFCPWALACS